MWEGAIAGVLTFVGLSLIYRKFPAGLRRFLSRKPVDIIVDILASIGIYFTLATISGSFAALVACAITASLISVGLNWERKRLWEVIEED